MYPTKDHVLPGASLHCRDATSALPAGTATARGNGADLAGYRACWRAGRSGLALAVAAVLAGADSVTAVAEWAADAPPEVLRALGAWQDRRGRLVPPSLKTFRRVLRRLDSEAVAAAFGTWLKSQALAGLADAAALVIALDGKTIRGARTQDGRAPHLLAAMICGARAVLAQKDVDAKTNEITFRTTAGARRFTPDDLRGGALRLYVAHTRSCEVHVAAHHPAHGRGTDTRQQADPTTAR